MASKCARLSPLRIVDNAPAVKASVDTGGYESRQMTHGLLGRFG